MARILHECTETIANEVESVKNLVNEFSQFARFPAAQPVKCDLNEVVESAAAVFAGRLDGIELRTELAPDLAPVNVDKEQFKRVVVNLVDNAAEAMQRFAGQAFGDHNAARGGGHRGSDGSRHRLRRDAGRQREAFPARTSRPRAGARAWGSPS